MLNETLVIIPTLNEAKSIGDTIDSVKKNVPNSVVVVVDSYSEDDTAEIALEHEAALISVPKGGKGIAMQHALKQLTAWDIPYWAMIDGDNTYDASVIPEMIEYLNVADVVMGTRVYSNGSMTRTNKIGNWGLSLLATFLYGGMVHDICTGLWAFRKEVITQFNITSPRFTLEADFYTQAKSNKCLILEVPVRYSPRKTGDTSKLKVSDGIDIGLFLIKERFSK